MKYLDCCRDNLCYVFIMGGCFFHISIFFWILNYWSSICLFISFIFCNIVQQFFRSIMAAVDWTCSFMMVTKQNEEVSSTFIDWPGAFWDTAPRPWAPATPPIRLCPPLPILLFFFKLMVSLMDHANAPSKILPLQTNTAPLNLTSWLWARYPLPGIFFKHKPIVWKVRYSAWYERIFFSFISINSIHCSYFVAVYHKNSLNS